MEYTRKQVIAAASIIRIKYRQGLLRESVVAQYESLPGWHWGRVYMLFSEARTVARAQHLAGSVEFFNWKKPEGMPSCPHRTYKDSGWLGWRDFLGTEYTSFTKARSLACAQHLASQVEFNNWKKPKGMPSHPDRVYADSGWLGWGDFLGTGNVRSKVYMSFAKARTVARAQHLASSVEFFNWNKPKGMPSRPDRTYKDSGWTNWYDFLGNKKRKTK